MMLTMMMSTCCPHVTFISINTMQKYFLTVFILYWEISISCFFDATCHWRRGWWPPGSFPEQPLSWGQQGNHLRVEVHADNKINHELLQRSTEDNWAATCFFQPHQNRILDEELLDGDQQWCPLVSSLVLGNNPADRTAASAKGPKKKIGQVPVKGWQTWADKYKLPTCKSLRRNDLHDPAWWSFSKPQEIHLCNKKIK